MICPPWHAKAIALYAEGGWTYEALGAEFGVTRFAVYRAVRKSRTARGLGPPEFKGRDREAHRKKMREYMRRKYAAAKEAKR